MSKKELPARPNLDFYKKQAKELARDWRSGDAGARDRVREFHPKFNAETAGAERDLIALADAQLAIAREHGFESWPKFGAHITTLNLTRSVAAIGDPVAAFLRAACAPRDGNHNSGTLEEAELILSRFPSIARANVYCAAVRADEESVRTFLAHDQGSALAKGGPHDWDALTYLCFSRYLRIDQDRSDAFARIARALLDAGANANTGWYETIDYPNPRQIIESAIYGAAGVAQNEGVTRVLLEYGADPNDEETPYHTAEGYDLGVLNALLESGKLNPESMTTLLLRKADWHDAEGIRVLLEQGADPNAMTRWGVTALHQALRRDNGLENIALMLDHGAEPALRTAHEGRSGVSIAARRGRGDVLRLLTERGIDGDLKGVERLISACALGDSDWARTMAAHDPQLVKEVRGTGGSLLMHFAANGNTEGVQCLLDLGVSSSAVSWEGDSYFDIAGGSTALHASAWRGWPSTVRLLIDRGAPVNALDGKGRTALMLAVKACVDSHWKRRRSPEWIEPLLRAGASVEGIEIPCGYEAADELLRLYAVKE